MRRPCLNRQATTLCVRAITAIIYSISPVDPPAGATIVGQDQVVNLNPGQTVKNTIVHSNGTLVFLAGAAVTTVLGAIIVLDEGLVFFQEGVNLHVDQAFSNQFSWLVFDQGRLGIQGSMSHGSVVEALLPVIVCHDAELTLASVYFS